MGASLMRRPLPGAESRDLIQTAYLRRVENGEGVWSNAEFDQIEELKDPGV